MRLSLLSLGGAVLVCACGGDAFVGAPTNDGGNSADVTLPDGGSLDGPAPPADGGADSHLCSKLSPAPQFCMDFDDGTLTTAYVKGVSTQIPMPSMNNGGVAKLTPAMTSPDALLTTTPATTLAGAGPQAGYQNILWTAPLGSQSYGNPVVANGKVFVGTNNGFGYLQRYPARTDLGCLLCFDEVRHGR